MPPTRIEIRSSVQLLVEGKDAENFFKKLVLRLSLPEVEVQNFGGVNQLRSYLAAFAVAPNFGVVRSIGIVRDAEQSAEAAFQSVRDSLNRANLPAPRRHDESAGGNPTVRVLILPGTDNRACSRRCCAEPSPNIP